jgi:hypothetical protein
MGVMVNLVLWNQCHRRVASSVVVSELRFFMGALKLSVAYGYACLLSLFLCLCFVHSFGMWAAFSV